MCYTKRKCPEKGFNNIINQEEMLCESCLDELGELIEKYPIISPYILQNLNKCEICGKKTENNPSDVQYNSGSMDKKIICDVCMTYFEPSPAKESLEMLRT